MPRQSNQEMDKLCRRYASDHSCPFLRLLRGPSLLRGFPALRISREALPFFLVFLSRDRSVSLTPTCGPSGSYAPADISGTFPTGLLVFRPVFEATIPGPI